MARFWNPTCEPASSTKDAIGQTIVPGDKVAYWFQRKFHIGTIKKINLRYDGQILTCWIKLPEEDRYLRSCHCIEKYDKDYNYKTYKTPFYEDLCVPLHKIIKIN